MSRIFGYQKTPTRDPLHKLVSPRASGVYNNTVQQFGAFANRRVDIATQNAQRQNGSPSVNFNRNIEQELNLEQDVTSEDEWELFQKSKKDSRWLTWKQIVNLDSEKYEQLDAVYTALTTKWRNPDKALEKKKQKFEEIVKTVQPYTAKESPIRKEIVDDIMYALDVRSEFLAKKKKDAERQRRKEDDSEKELLRRVNSHQNVPQIRPGSLIEDLDIFTTWLGTTLAPTTDYLPLLVKAVPLDKSTIINTIIESGVCQHMDWASVCRYVLLNLYPEKSLESHMNDFRKLRPRIGESMRKFINRFLRYQTILDVSDAQAVEIFIESIPPEFQKICNQFRYNSATNYSEPITDLDMITGHLMRMYTNPDVMCFIGRIHTQAGPNTLPRGNLSYHGRNNNQFNVNATHSHRVGGHVDNRMVNFDTCWSCNRSGHKQETCSVPQSNVVRHNMYKFKPVTSTIAPNVSNKGKGAYKSTNPKDKFQKTKKAVKINNLNVKVHRYNQNADDMGSFEQRELDVNNIKSMDGTNDPVADNDDGFVTQDDESSDTADDDYDQFNQEPDPEL